MQVESKSKEYCQGYAQAIADLRSGITKNMDKLNEQSKTLGFSQSLYTVISALVGQSEAQNPESKLNKVLTSAMVQGLIQESELNDWMYMGNNELKHSRTKEAIYVNLKKDKNN